MSETALKIAKPPRPSKDVRRVVTSDYRVFFANLDFIVRTAFKICESQACKDVQLELLRTAARIVREKVAEFEEKERSA